MSIEKQREEKKKVETFSIFIAWNVAEDFCTQRGSGKSNKSISQSYTQNTSLLFGYLLNNTTYKKWEYKSESKFIRQLNIYTFTRIDLESIADTHLGKHLKNLYFYLTITCLIVSIFKIWFLHTIEAIFVNFI